MFVVVAMSFVLRDLRMGCLLQDSLGRRDLEVRKVRVEYQVDLDLRVCEVQLDQRATQEQ